MKFGLEMRVYQRDRVFFNIINLVFVKKGGFNIDRVIEDLNVLEGVLRKEKEEEFRKERQWRESVSKKK